MEYAAIQKHVWSRVVLSVFQCVRIKSWYSRFEPEQVVLDTISRRFNRLAKEYYELLVVQQNSIITMAFHPRI